MTNDGFGLLRVLAPDIFGLIATTILIVIVAVLINRFIGAAGKAEPHANVSSARSTTRHVAFWIWALALIGVSLHAVSVTWSLRVPRSDVDPSAVHRQMDGLTQGSPR